ncbi:MAG: trypsin-like serine protease [Deltaproteobacteria bacterium]|nr:trypsin-like serine protease [Deltaproteobacteria bacterium]
MKMVQIISLVAFFASTLASNAFAVVGGKTNPRTPGVQSRNYPSIIGYKVRQRDGKQSVCSATRISGDDYVTAGHCFDSSSNPQDLKVDILTANGDSFENLTFKEIRVSDDFSGVPPSERICVVFGACSDAATFSLNLASDQKEKLDQLVDVVRVRTTPVGDNEKLTITGFGCSALNADLKCSNDFSFNRSEFNFGQVGYRGTGAPLNPLFGDRYLVTNQAGIEAAPGDSGGGLFDKNGLLVGLNMGKNSLYDKHSNFHTNLNNPAAFKFTNAKLDCVSIENSKNGFCQPKPSKEEREKYPGGMLTYVEVNPEVYDVPSCMAAASKTYCHSININAAHTRCLADAGVSMSMPSCTVFASCLSIKKTNIGCNPAQ